MDAPRPAIVTPRLHKILSGGAPIAPAIVEAFEERFGAYIHNIYGLTETTSPSHSSLGARARSIPLRRAVGRRPRLRHRGARGRRGRRDVAPGEVGEIVTAGPQVVPGY